MHLNTAPTQHTALETAVQYLFGSCSVVPAATSPVSGCASSCLLWVINWTEIVQPLSSAFPDARDDGGSSDSDYTNDKDTGPVAIPSRFLTPLA